MVEQKKKMRLDELKVESFVTTSPVDAQKTMQVHGGDSTRPVWWCVLETIVMSIQVCPTKGCQIEPTGPLCSAGGETNCCS